jgi:alkanesulfonate monooxygenase SsuD/methylene tetrahydromethanopterin reductase-like flavin-dependent oxidoreductase (luciferase family)
MGLPFAFAGQLAPENLMIAFDLYRKNFRPSTVLDKPYAMVCFGVFAAEDEKEAYRQSRTFAHSMMRMMYNKSYVLPSPGEVEAYPYDELELRTINLWHEKVLYGTPEQVVEKLNRYQEVIKADELMIVNVGHSPAAIYNSAQLIADA